MRAPIARALAWDALYQVLDNWVFRILAVLTLVPILFTFVLGFREEGIVLLFGLKTWSYGGLFEALGGPAAAVKDAQGQVIEGVLRTVFDVLAGGLGMLFCIAATSFFVPRMLEKGAADVLFHKPVSRWTLYLSRYLAGLFFIAIVSCLLVGGMYLGLLLVSGHNDPGMLVAALSLTYVFALIHAVSMLVGVVTRSTVASILLTALFFAFNGCVHNIWIGQQQISSGQVPGLGSSPSSPEEDSSSSAGTEAAREEGPDPDREPRAGPWSFLLTILDVLHYTLPKTSDADHLGRKLRASVGRPWHREEDSRVTLYRLPEDTQALGLDTIGEVPLSAALRERLGEPRFLLCGSAPGETALSYSLWRRPAETSESKIGNRTRSRRETTSQASSILTKVLEADPSLRDLAHESIHFGASAEGRDSSAALLRWSEAARTREALLFKGADSDTLYTLLIDAEGEQSPERMDELRGRIDTKMGIDDFTRDWYQDQLGLGAPLRFNILFSIGSSLAFTALMLGLGWWQLRKIEF